jgi:hypothetical protein
MLGQAGAVLRLNAPKVGKSKLEALAQRIEVRELARRRTKCSQARSCVANGRAHGGLQARELLGSGAVGGCGGELADARDGVIEGGDGVAERVDLVEERIHCRCRHEGRVNTRVPRCTIYGGRETRGAVRLVPDAFPSNVSASWRVPGLGGESVRRR